MPSCCLTAHTCLAERARAMRLNGPHGWSIPCMDCVEGCARQMDRWTPEPDVDLEARHFFRPINPKDFEEPVKKVENRGKAKRPTPACKKGHLFSKFGKKRANGRWDCKVCHAERRKELYRKKKAAKEQAVVDYIQRHREAG